MAMQKPTPYLKRVLKELDRDLRELSKEHKVKALHAYKFGIENTLFCHYPDRFSLPAGSTESLEDPASFYEQGADVGNKFGPLEVESAREFLIAEVKKRKAKFSKPSFLEKLNEFLIEYYHSFGRGFGK